MNPGQVGAQLRASNPWWRDPAGWETSDPDLRSADLAGIDYHPRPLDHLEPGALYVLRGPRRVGKSVELKRVAGDLLRTGAKPLQIIHLAVETWRANDLGHLVSVGRSQLSASVDPLPRYWLIDEITSVTGDWANQIKFLRDNTPFHDDCVVLTGSSARDLTAATKALAGRHGSARDADRTLLPMGLRGYCQARGLAIDLPAPMAPADLRSPAARRALLDLQPWQDDLVNAWETYLLCGGFPTAVADFHGTGAVSQPFIQALWDVIQGEALRSGSFSATQAQELLEQVTLSLTSTGSVRSWADAVGATRDVTAARLEDLASAYMTWHLHRDQGGGRPALGSRRKTYFTDPILARLSSMLAVTARREPDMTTLAEQQIGMALARAGEVRAPGTFTRHDGVLFHRTGSDREVDFVSGQLEVTPLEVKYSDRPWRRDAQTLRSALGSGIVCTRSVLDLADDVWAVPAAFVAALIDT